MLLALINAPTPALQSIPLAGGQPLGLLLTLTRAGPTAALQAPTPGQPIGLLLILTKAS